MFVWHLHFWLPALYIPRAHMEMDVVMDMGLGVQEMCPGGNTWPALSRTFVAQLR